jgi:hypothetical protein
MINLDSESQTQQKVIVVSGRVHPGEANSSWVMQGFLDFLLGPKGSDLRKK